MKKIIIGSVLFMMSGLIVSAQTTTNKPVQLFEPIRSILPVKPVEVERREGMNVIEDARDRVRTYPGKLEIQNASDDSMLKNQIQQNKEVIKQQVEATREALKAKTETIRETIKKETEAAREAFKTEREDILKAVSEGPKEAMELLQERRQEFQKEVEVKKEELKNTIQERRADAEKIITAKREELKTKLGQFKDEQKKRVTEQVSENLNKVSQNAVNRFTNNINELERALTNISTRADKATANGGDVSSVLAAIQIAKNAIESARNVVSVQAGKTYSVTISTEAKVADDLKIARDTLHVDLKAVQEKVQTAHAGVLSALMELQKIPNINKPVSSVDATSPDKESQESTTVTQ